MRLKSFIMLFLILSITVAGIAGFANDQDAATPERETGESLSGIAPESGTDESFSDDAPENGDGECVSGDVSEQTRYDSILSVFSDWLNEKGFVNEMSGDEYFAALGSYAYEGIPLTEYCRIISYGGNSDMGFEGISGSLYFGYSYNVQDRIVTAESYLRMPMTPIEGLELPFGLQFDDLKTEVAKKIGLPGDVIDVLAADGVFPLDTVLAEGENAFLVYGTNPEIGSAADLSENFYLKYQDELYVRGNGQPAKMTRQIVLAVARGRLCWVDIIVRDGYVETAEETDDRNQNPYVETPPPSDAKITMPGAGSENLVLAGEDCSVTLIPKGNPESVPVDEIFLAENTVVYRDIFGDGTDLRYAEVYSGVRERIILSQYNGTDTFEFVIRTNGLSVYGSGGNYYFAKEKDAAERIIITDVVVYDRMGKPEAGSVLVEEIAAGEYKLTVTGSNYLFTDWETVYPVTVEWALILL